HRQKPDRYGFDKEEDISEEKTGNNDNLNLDDHCDSKSDEREQNHHIKWQDFKILSKNTNPYCLLIKESLQIIARTPDLNSTTRPVPLVIFPEGSVSLNRKEQTKVKIKRRHYDSQNLSFL
ncbi:unnamed protein product, partial [Didymodactylos carnosus]